MVYKSRPSVINAPLSTRTAFTNDCLLEIVLRSRSTTSTVIMMLRSRLAVGYAGKAPKKSIASMAISATGVLV